jgi:hypothetical protein
MPLVLWVALQDGEEPLQQSLGGRRLQLSFVVSQVRHALWKKKVI